MRDDFGIMVLGVVAGAAIIALAVLLTLGWNAGGIRTVSLDLTPPVFYVPN